MSTYRDHYIARGIPEFNPSACAPYPVGQVPQSGWYLIEPAGTYRIPLPDIAMPADQRPEVDEVIDETALREIAAGFDPAVNGGLGLQINNDHLYLRTTGDNPALGWCKALDYGRLDGRLHQAAYIVWTTDTHALINQGKYWAWSTEYRLVDYAAITDSSYRPTRLSGLAVTNRPDHEDQPGIIRHLPADVIAHSRGLTISKQQTTMPKQAQTQRVLHSEGNPEEDDKDTANLNNDTPANTEDDKKEGETNTNNDDAAKDATNCNSEEEGWLDICNQIAAALNLPDTATGDDILQAVQDLKTDCDLLKQQVDSGDTQAHSRRRHHPRVLHSKAAIRLDKDVTPKGTVTHRTPEGKAVQVPQSDVDLITHCRKTVSDEETRRGRPLSAGEYDAAWSRGAASYAATINPSH